MEPIERTKYQRPSKFIHGWNVFQNLISFQCFARPLRFSSQFVELSCQSCNTRCHTIPDDILSLTGWMMFLVHGFRGLRVLFGYLVMFITNCLIQDVEWQETRVACWTHESLCNVMGLSKLIGVWIDTYVFYQSVLQKKTWIWSLCVAKT